MKKRLLLTFIFAMLLLVTGCGGSKTKTMTCTRKGTVTKGTTYSYNYKVTYTGDYVDNISITEEVTSDDEDYLDTLKETVEAMYEPYDGIKYHEYDVDITGNKLVSHRNINYKEIDTDKLIEVDSSNSAIIKDGKVSVDDVKSIYKQLGLECK